VTTLYRHLYFYAKEREYFQQKNKELLPSENQCNSRSVYSYNISEDIEKDIEVVIHYDVFIISISPYSNMIGYNAYVI